MASADTKNDKWIYTVGRVLLFCLCCAVVLAISSGLTKGLATVWAPIFPVAAAAIGALLLTLLFVKWEGLGLKDVGLLPGPGSVRRLLAGLAIGIFLAALQPLLVLSAGHITLIRSPEISVTVIIANLLLYLAVACREEVAFRGYPLRSLNYAIGPRGAQLIVALIFILEHKVGGMTWPQALTGPGVGAILFGLAALKTKGLALPVGLHMAWNTGQWLLGFKDGTGIYKVMIEKGYEVRVGQTGWISYLLVMGLAILAFYYWRKKPANSAVQ